MNCSYEKRKAGPLQALAGGCAAMLLLSTAALAQTAEQGPPQRIIVKWKNNQSMAVRGTAAQQSMDVVGRRVGAGMSRMRTIATGAELVRASRRMSRTEMVVREYMALPGEVREWAGRALARVTA